MEVSTDTFRLVWCLMQGIWCNSSAGLSSAAADWLASAPPSVPTSPCLTVCFKSYFCGRIGGNSGAETTRAFSVMRLKLFTKPFQDDYFSKCLLFVLLKKIPSFVFLYLTNRWKFFSLQLLSVFKVKLLYLVNKHVLMFIPKKQTIK